jgi:N-hydroxyarylamine O-acetyltransferase
MLPDTRIMQIKKYLSKIQIPQINTPDLNFLKELQRNHIESIPWENIDIYFKNNITLDINMIVNKFLNSGRGGICFELNAAYYHLLKELGFDAKLISVKIFGFNDKKYNIPRETHIVILVRFDNQYYITDVGWDGYRQPLPLTGETVKDIAGIHRISKDNNNYYMEKKINESWHIQYQLLDNPISLDDCICHIDYRNANPEREVAYQLLYMKHTRNGLISLVDNTISFQENGKILKYQLDYFGGIRSVLTKIFHIEAATIPFVTDSIALP